MPEDMRKPLASARATLGASGARLAEADRLLVDAVLGAHRVAAESSQRLAAIGAEIDAAVARHSSATPAAGRDFGRFLLAKNREISAIVAEARAESAAKAVVLRTLAGEYRSAALP